jgi:uncharacterized membrane protein (UPF0127 family)
MLRRLLLVAVPILALALSAIAAEAPADFGQGRVAIDTASGRHLLSVEVATTPAQRGYGLMFRKELPPDSGMLFLYPKEGEISMWMKNTFIALDMLFIDKSGAIVHIAEGAVPQSLDIIPSEAPAKAVLEVPAGTAQRLSIKEGDRVIYPAPE